MPVSSRKQADAVRFGAVIHRLRVERGWTLAKLAQRSGMNPTYLGVLEKGGNMVSLTTLFELADVFSIPAAEIVREVEEMRRQARARPRPEHPEPAPS
jgi:XRE family transcriptional regulator, regulator of sulfur utilization